MLASSTKRFSLVLLPVFLLFFAVGTILLSPPKASALTIEHSFQDASVWTLESLRFDLEDLNDGDLDLDNDTKDALRGDGGDQDIVDEVNRLVEAQIVGDFIDVDARDRTKEYVRKANTCNESSIFRASEFGDDGIPTKYKIDRIQLAVAGVDCEDIISDKKIDVTPSGADKTRSRALFSFVDEFTLVRVDGIDGNFVDDPEDNRDRTFFREDESGNSQDTVELGDSTSGEFNTAEYRYDPGGDNLFFVTQWSVFNPITNDDGSVDVNPNNTTFDDVDAEPNCNNSGGDFSFILCPLLNIVSGTVDELDQRIRGALEVRDNYYASGEVRASWARFRDIGYIILIPVVLIMVISTALGFQFVDAYTVKRAMPRLLIAVIFMALSFDICRILIEITNTVGNGMAGLIASPFGGEENLRFNNIFSAGEVSTLGITGVAGFVSVTAALALGAVSLTVLASYLGVAALALLIIFSLLSIRELIIIFLIILSPLAILSWIFPGNDKLWKLWWGTFSKLLLIFPFIIGLLMIGRGFARIVFISDAGGLEAVFGLIVKLTAYIGPFFFIPKAFSFAGGVLGNLAGMANDRSKGIFDRQKAFRRKKLGEDWKRTREGKGITRGLSGGMKNHHGRYTSRQDRVNERLQKLANAEKAFDGENNLLKNGGLLKSINRNITTAITRNLEEEQKHFDEDKDGFFSKHDDQSGLGGDTSMGRYHSIEEKLLDYGYAVDEHGNVDEVKMKAVIDEIQTKRAKGDFNGAYRTALLAANHKDNAFSTIFDGDKLGDKEDEEVNRSVSNMANLRNKYSKEVFDLSMAQRAAAGGTYYQGGEAALEALKDATVGDLNAYAAGSVKMRNALMQTGRTDQGAISHGQSFAVRNMLDTMQKGIKAGDTTELKKQMEKANWDKERQDEILAGNEKAQMKASREVTSDHIANVVYEQQGAQTLTHTAIKTERVLKNMLPVLTRNLKTAETKANGELEINPNYDDDKHTDYAPGKNDAIREYARQLAGGANIWQSLQGSKPEVAAKMAPSFIGMEMANGRTLGETIDIAAGTSDTYRTYHKEYMAKSADIEEMNRRIEEIRRVGGPEAAAQIAQLEQQRAQAGGLGIGEGPPPGGASIVKSL